MNNTLKMVCSLLATFSVFTFAEMKNQSLSNLLSFLNEMNSTKKVFSEYEIIKQYKVLVLNEMIDSIYSIDLKHYPVMKKSDLMVSNYLIYHAPMGNELAVENAIFRMIISELLQLNISSNIDNKNIEYYSRCGNASASSYLRYHFNRCLVLLRRTNYEEASKCFQPIDECMRWAFDGINYDEYYFVKGFINMKLKKIEESLSEFQKIVYLFPSSKYFKVSKYVLFVNGKNCCPTGEEIVATYCDANSLKMSSYALRSIAIYNFSNSFDLLTNCYAYFPPHKKNQIFTELGFCKNYRVVPYLKYTYSNANIDLKARCVLSLSRHNDLSLIKDYMQCSGLETNFSFLSRNMPRDLFTEVFGNASQLDNGLRLFDQLRFFE